MMGVDEAEVAASSGALLLHEQRVQDALILLNPSCAVCAVQQVSKGPACGSRPDQQGRYQQVAAWHMYVLCDDTVL